VASRKKSSLQAHLIKCAMRANLTILLLKVNARRSKASTLVNIRTVVRYAQNNSNMSALSSKTIQG
jgi:hypothetical protein